MAGPLGSIVDVFRGGESANLPGHPWRNASVAFDPRVPDEDEQVVATLDEWSEYFERRARGHEVSAMEGNEPAATEALARLWVEPGNPGPGKPVDPDAANGAGDVREAADGPDEASDPHGPLKGEYATRIGGAVEAVEGRGESFGPEGRRAVSVLHAAFHTDELDDSEGTVEAALTQLDDALDYDIADGAETVEFREYHSTERREELRARVREESPHYRAMFGLDRVARLPEIADGVVAEHTELVADVVRAARTVHERAATGQLADEPAVELGEMVGELAAMPAVDGETPESQVGGYEDRLDRLRTHVEAVRAGVETDNDPGLSVDREC